MILFFSFVIIFTKQFHPNALFLVAEKKNLFKSELEQYKFINIITLKSNVEQAAIFAYVYKMTGFDAQGTSKILYIYINKNV